MVCTAKEKKRKKVDTEASEVLGSQKSSDKSDAALQRIRESFGVNGPFTPIKDARDKDPGLVQWWEVVIFFSLKR